MSRERTPAGNILALARSREEKGKDVEEAATSYMPTSIDLDTLMPDDVPQGRGEVPNTLRSETRSPGKHQRSERSAPKARASAVGAAGKRKRISLYLDDEVLTKIFRVSLERHEQMLSATHRLIIEALKARGL
ncbi:Hypothetical protein NGAL_HAMBI490_48180 [Neorhizobium galegae bv. officinalis]|uniref:hypothetical protein n=2 Tax=Neorhizobium galegae TaxID=399 RepID=UPI0006221A9E|nr:hypothetical protein [Neorhizobium galegae]CDZ29950.1 Hypothetical protein NGAL_HAMBI490_48180 [Neorhizobium galegae bv. officinalis]